MLFFAVHIYSDVMPKDSSDWAGNVYVVFLASADDSL